MNEKIKKIILSPLDILYKISPKTSLKILFFIKQKQRLNLKNPKTYNEKINWLKLYYRNDLMPICADKYAVRDYVKDCGYEHLLNELYWEGFDARDIPFKNLPNQFVIKTSHGSGQNIICEDKTKLDIPKTIEKLNKWLKTKYLPSYGEWFYGKVKPRIIVEKLLMTDNNQIPEDYKMFCFNNYKGRQDVGFTVIDMDRFTNHKRNVYSQDWDVMEDVQVNWYQDKTIIHDKPNKYNEMLKAAKDLATPFPHARIDFYVVQNTIFFGEITFTSDAGFGKLNPDSFHKKVGSWIQI